MPHGWLPSRQQPQGQGKASIATLHRRAADWLVRHEQQLPAIRHLLEAGDEDEAAALVESRIRPAILQHPVRAQQLFDALPPEVAQRRPRLMLERCLISVINATNQDLTDHVDNAQRCLSKHASSQPLRELYEAELLLYRALAHYGEGDFQSAALVAQQVRSQSDHLDRLLSGTLEFLWMRLGIIAADTTAQQSHAMRALAAFNSVGFVVGQIAVRRELAMLDVQAGRSARASREFDSITRTFGNDPLRPRPELEWVYAYAAEHSYWQDQLDQAMRYIEAGMEIASTFQNDDMLNALIYLQQLCACRRQQPRALREPSTTTGEVRAWYGFVDWQIRWLLAIGRVDEAWKVARRYQAGQTADWDSLPHFRAVPYLRVCVARGVDLEAARPLLNGAFERSVLANDLPRQLELLALRAWLELQTGQEAVARQTLSRAEELVARTGYVRVLLDIPALAARWHDEDEIPSPVEALPQLSKREQAVLILLGERLTYGQIGKELVISINTVRSHVRHIYKKLGVSTRDQAIQRAQELGLLS